MCWPRISDGVSSIIFDNSLLSFANGVRCMYDSGFAWVVKILSNWERVRERETKLRENDVGFF